MTKLKKYVCEIFVFVIFLIIILSNESNAAYIEVNDEFNIVCYIYENVNQGVTTDDLLEELYQNYDYNQNGLFSPLRVSTTVTIESVKDKTYEVKLGNQILGATHIKAKKSWWQELWDFDNRLTEDQVRNILGYEGKTEDLVKGTQWNIVIEAEPQAPRESKYMQDRSDGLQFVYFDACISATKVWTGEDIENAGVWNTQPENAKEVEVNSETLGEKTVEVVDEIVDTVEDIYEKVKKAWNFMEYPKETIIKLLLDLIKVVLGDAPQMLANTAQTGLKTWKIMYDYDSFGKKYDYLAEYVGYGSKHSDKTHQKRYYNRETCRRS